MKFRNISLEYGLVILAFLFGLGLRLLHLGQAPLSDVEASWALQALDLARAGRPLIGAQPGYVLLTSVLFLVFNGGNFAARLLPALAGSWMALAPLLFRRQLGRWPAVVLSFWLAFAPELAAISRQADGFIFALTFSVLAAGLLLNRRYAWAGISAGLALLGGPGIWAILFTLGLAFLWTRLFSWQMETPVDEAAASRQGEWLRALPWLGGTLLVVGTRLFTAPAGLSAAASSLAVYLAGWAGPVQTPIHQMLLVLAAYAPLALLFGFLGIAWGWRNRNRVDLFLAIWALIGLLLALVYPSRRTFDLALGLLPLWALAGRQIVRLSTRFKGDRLALAGQILLVIILLVFSWLNFVNLARPSASAAEVQTYLISIAVALALLAAATLMIGWGWAWEVAGTGLLLGLSLALSVYTLSSAWNASGLGRRPAAEALRDGPFVLQADLLYQTVTEFSQWNTLADNGLDLAVLDVDSPALRWLLRDYEGAQFVNALPGASPSMLITSVQESPQLPAAYTGQDFVWAQSPNWRTLFQGDWMRWWIVREAPADKQLLVLWVRSDLFPGAAITDSLTP